MAAVEGKTANGKAAETEEASFYDDAENLKKLCNFLRSKEGPAVREAVEMDKRVYYLRGEKLVSFIVEPKKGSKWPVDLPRIKSRPEAIAICKDLCRYQFIHRSERRGKGDLVMSRAKDFDESAYFTWVYEGDKTFSHFMTTLLIGGFLFCVCFPIWPNFLKVFVWYMSVTLLIMIFSMILVRAVVFLFLWVIGFEFWFLPNLFDETLGFFDSFKPVISIEKTKPGQLMYRIGVLVGLSSFCYWAVTQPSEFDGFVSAQGDFLKDLYAGTLLSDVSQQDKEDIDKPRMPSLDDLLRKLDSDDAEEEEELSEEDRVDTLFDSLLEDEDDSMDEE